MGRVKGRDSRKKLSLLKRALKWVFVYLPLGFFAFSLVQVTLMKWMPVLWTPLMTVRVIQNAGDEDFKIRKKWTRIEDISPNMYTAVIGSEDNRFVHHFGFDLEEIRQMLDRHRTKGGKLRGCSTISQQTAKNCFTFCTKAWPRKVIEAYYTVLIEAIWGKERIMEVYLNVAEMGSGIFGAEAAARHYYGKSASQLTLRQAACIACVLPNPLRRTPAWVAGRMTQSISKIERFAVGRNIVLERTPDPSKKSNTKK